VAPHITLAYLHNILGDTIKLNQEQQLMMERSNSSDWVIQISMELYKLRGLKENTYGGIKFLKERIATEGETRDNQLELAYSLLTVGQFDEARVITDKYLLKNSKDIDFLFMRLNIEMSFGNLDKMKDYESKILAINPKAFDK
ncbi:MAG TPA: hypothetical protein VJL37_01825, partial [Flavobacterium sp.]|nr:hypothetical protein [Flavobacterium sp.]